MHRSLRPESFNEEPSTHERHHTEANREHKYVFRNPPSLQNQSRYHKYCCRDYYRSRPAKGARKSLRSTNRHGNKCTHCEGVGPCECKHIARRIIVACHPERSPDDRGSSYEQPGTLQSAAVALKARRQRARGRRTALRRPETKSDLHLERQRTSLAGSRAGCSWRMSKAIPGSPVSCSSAASIPLYMGQCD